MMVETELAKPMKNIADENLIIQEYEVVIESLQQNLKECQIEQERLRNEIETSRIENKTALEVARDAFSHANLSECPGSLENQECIENLKKQISIIQLEKESMFQLWQMALKSVETLEQEIKVSHGDGKTAKYYEEQIVNVKKAYTEAIQALEIKLVQTRDNFTKHQVFWESAKETVETLKSEKSECERKLANLQNEFSIKEESSQRMIETVKAEIGTTKQEIEAVNKYKLKLEAELIEARCFAAKMTAKDQESKDKVAEAIELIESAMKEKEIALERQKMILDEKSKLESQLTKLSEDFAARLDKELTEAKDNFERNSEKYIFEIKELRAELREKATIVDRLQREYRLLEEEQEKSKHGSDEFLQKSSAKVLELERKLKDAEYKLSLCEEDCRQKYEEKVRFGNNKITELEEKLANCNDKLRRNQINSLRDTEERVREADERTKEAVERYSNLEKRLARALDERESFAGELRTLQSSFDREISRRDNERRLLEGRVRELQEDLRNANDLVDKTTLRANSLVGKIEILERSVEQRISSMGISNDNLQQTTDLDKSNFKLIRDQYEEKISELTRYVKIHQKLSHRWKEEAESLATKFQKRYKELRSKISMLKNENDELNKELIVCRQQVIVCRSQLMQRLDDDDGR